MKYQSLYDIYIDTVKKMASEQEYWKTFLSYAGKMYRYKFSTLVTAFAQNPNYTQLVTYEQWNRMGYHIRRGEKSTPVLMDNHYKMSHIRSIDYMVSQRCNLESVEIPKIDSILNYEQMTAVGWCTMTVARGMLLESKAIINDMRRERKPGS